MDQRMQIRILQAENINLRKQVEALRSGDAVEKFVCAALTGASARLDDPEQVAEFAIKTADALVKHFQGVADVGEEQAKEADAGHSEETNDESVASPSVEAALLAASELAKEGLSPTSLILPGASA